MHAQHDTHADLAEAFGLLGQPPAVSLLAQTRAAALDWEHALPPRACVVQQQALLARVLARLAPEDAHDSLDLQRETRPPDISV